MRRSPRWLTSCLAIPALACAVSLVHAAEPLPAAAVERFAELALACVHQEYPNKLAHTLASDADVLPPRTLTPAFYGCYDWHSSVHGHWLLARLARSYPDAPFAPRARAALAASLTTARIAAEVRYLEGPGRVSFERPYGLAWLLQLHAELAEWDDPQARGMGGHGRAFGTSVRAEDDQLAAEAHAAGADRRAQPDGLRARIGARLGAGGRRQRELRGVHRGDQALLSGRSPLPPRLRTLWRGLPLSPGLAEADVVGRVLSAREFARWLDGFLPQVPRDGRGDWLEPGVVTDPTDPKLAHLDGLNLSRAWMAEGIAARLPAADARRAALLAVARLHREAALPHVTGEHYEGSHWLGSFATYLVTGRGLPAAAR